MRDRLQHVLERRILLVDSVLAAALLGLAVVISASTSTDGAEWVLTIALVAPLPWRRVAPVAIFAVVMVLCLVALALSDHAIGGHLAALVALYTLVAYGPSLRLAGAGLACVCVGGIASALRWDDDELAVAASLIMAVVHALLAAALGFLRRLALERAAADVERAALDERTRIARELHDVVAHSLSVIVVQADSGRYAARTDPAAAERALATISETSRAALADMRTALGALRGAAPEPVQRGPQPGIGELDALVERVADAGLDVELAVVGAPRPLPGGVDVTVFRVAQEALTNVLKHGGPDASAVVTLRYAPADVTVEVRDTGAGAAGGGDGLGQGVRGMRERVTLQGGELATGPRPEGGWEVRATLPAAR